MFQLYPEFPSSPLLKFLSPVEREQLFSATDCYAFSTGERVVYSKDSEDMLYLIEEGRVEVVKHDKGERIRLAILKAGNVFGEVGFLSGRPRTADVYALEAAKIRFFEPARLQEVLASDDGLAARFLMALSHILCERLSSTITMLSNTNVPAQMQAESDSSSILPRFDSGQFSSVLPPVMDSEPKGRLKARIEPIPEVSPSHDDLDKGK